MVPGTSRPSPNSRGSPCVPSVACPRPTKAPTGTSLKISPPAPPVDDVTAHRRRPHRTRPVSRSGIPTVAAARACGLELRLLPVGVAERPDLPGQERVVGEEVGALQIGDGLAAIDVTSDDRPPAIGPRPPRVVVDRRRQLQPIALAATQARARRALHAPPAEVGAASAARRVERDLLAGLLPDVTDVQVAGHGIEAEAPGVAQSQRPDLLGRHTHARERIVVWDAERQRVHVDAQDLPQPRAQRLRVAPPRMARPGVVGPGRRRPLRCRASRRGARRPACPRCGCPGAGRWSARRRPSRGRPDPRSPRCSGAPSCPRWCW